jgi:hypothetical protein
MENLKATCEPKLVTKTLDELFDNDFHLSIPPYQRAYEWESYHIKSLLCFYSIMFIIIF